MKSATRRMIIAALFAALVAAATLAVRIPSPLGGYINVGDALVLLAGGLLSPLSAFLAAGIGSALADLFSGYVIYAPATFIIKGCMALIVSLGVGLLKRKIGVLPSRIIFGAAAEAVMILGYYLFEGIIYGFVPSVVNIPFNGVQGAAGLVLGTVLTTVLSRMKIRFK